jgi:hypothetical protein
MTKQRLLCVAVFVIFVAFNCGKKVMVPPRIDLLDHEIIGIIEFECSNEGTLGQLTTRKFTEAIRKDQGMVRIIDLGTEEEVLSHIGHDKLDANAFKAIGEESGVRTVFTGELVISNIRPNISIISGLVHMGISAEVDATLSSQMVETSTGASVWSSSASATREVGQVSVSGDVFFFDAQEPEKAYGELVDVLVYETTRDFRVTWRRE